MFAAYKCYDHWACVCVCLTCMCRFFLVHLHKTLCETLRGNLYLVIMEGLICVHFTCFVSTFTHWLSQLEINRHPSCSPHGPRLIRLSGHKGINSVWSHITHINTPELKWVACVSGYMTQTLFLIESCPFIIQSWETKVCWPVVNYQSMEELAQLLVYSTEPSSNYMTPLSYQETQKWVNTQKS